MSDTVKNASMNNAEVRFTYLEMHALVHALIGEIDTTKPHEHLDSAYGKLDEAIHMVETLRGRPDLRNNQGAERAFHEDECRACASRKPDRSLSSVIAAVRAIQ